MKWKTVLVLLSIALSIIAPPSLHLMNGHEAQIGTLNVCHSATPALSSNGDIPCMNEYPCHLPLEESAIDGIPAPLFKPLLITFQAEHPPKV